MDLQYEVTYLLNGEEHVLSVDASSAAEASELARQQVCGDTDTYELIQILMVSDQSDATN